MSGPFDVSPLVADETFAFHKEAPSWERPCACYSLKWDRVLDAYGLCVPSQTSV